MWEPLLDQAWCGGHSVNHGRKHRPGERANLKQQPQARRLETWSSRFGVLLPASDAQRARRASSRSSTVRITGARRNSS